MRITVIDYTQTEYQEFECSTIEESFAFKDKPTVSWINIDGLHDLETIEKIGRHFDLHPLLLEDILNTQHRPKADEFDDYTFITLKMLGIDLNGALVIEQVSMVVGNNWLISFQERPGDIFDHVRLSLKESKGSIRSKGADYLVYRIMDTVVDHYFFVIEHITDVIEKLELDVLNGTNGNVLPEIQTLKKELILLKKAIMPLREVVTELTNENNKVFQNTTHRYLRDVYEHIIQVYESIDSQQLTLASITDLYLSGTSNKMNQVMKVLTVISTIFIPLTFIAGIYGMNFPNMPEFKWPHSYLAVWIIMLTIVVVMLYYFKRKRWL